MRLPVGGELACSRCGEERPPALDFHHTDDKEQSVSEMVNDGYAKTSIRDGIERCWVLCANCHRERHFEPPRSEHYDTHK